MALKRELNCLGARKWVARFVITDQPAPGEIYLTPEQIREQFEMAQVEAGITFEIDTLEMMHDYQPCGPAPKEKL